MVDPVEGPGGPAPPVLDQNEARRPEKIFFETAPPPLSQGLDDCAPLSQGLDDHPPLSQGLDDCAPPYLKVWICHCSKLSRIIVIKTNLYGTVQAFLMSYGICLGL